MKKIVIGGQIEKGTIEELLQKYGKGNYEITVKTDIDAAMALKSGAADYYFGACNTGGGGALAMAIALLGGDKTATLGMPGKTASKEEISQSVAAGKIAFGFTSQDMEFIISNVMKALENKGE
ncbi:DUF2620 domain-containing protein [Enterococcus caccae]|uniref:DUF2620 domain-containing protein n=1 Tax=Enterococcus caccae ATCC BAA-1240 TaxID=1158612 RepID=R3W6W9_9ENTE|nr:DUF2620 domain-containing protein [Enterococcus caccae]EOL43451.1 hypothetical protein UC7_02780 [Enterococcus caccae ATCC BAA-1240]EOT68149.1 hypothetical protein I580_00532 [Enterococcus caccae ATCC BAA-1240]OJG26987.1 hypothetical protein RU98_GL003078 [Enterococcus caccae]